jgi:hypothetical protein
LKQLELQQSRARLSLLFQQQSGKQGMLRLLSLLQQQRASRATPSQHCLLHRQQQKCQKLRLLLLLMLSSWRVAVWSMTLYQQQQQCHLCFLYQQQVLSSCLQRCNRMHCCSRLQTQWLQQQQLVMLLALVLLLVLVLVLAWMLMQGARMRQCSSSSSLYQQHCRLCLQQGRQQMQQQHPLLLNSPLPLKLQQQVRHLLVPLLLFLGQQQV